MTTPDNDAHDRRCPRHNDFQDDLPSLRAYVARHLIGEWVVMDKDDAFVAPPNGAAWGGPQRVRGQITRVLYDGCFLCAVQFGDEEPTPVTAASFMLLSTEWCWEQKCARDDDRPIKPASKHARSVERARFLMQQLIAAHGGQNMEEVVVAGFDGNGENRRGFEQALDEAGVPLHERPLVVNFDFDAVVAFHQALRFGRKHSRYSRADWRRRKKKGWVEGIERLIMEESGALFTKEEKRNVGLLYLDYCGGPDDSIDYEAVYANLPNLKVLGITAARRQPRISCGERLRAAAPAHMQEIHTFEHTRVVCKVFTQPARQPPKPEPPKPEPPKPEPPKPEPPKPPRRKTVRKTIDKAAASRCIGKIVRIPIDRWVDGLGREWDGALRVADKLCFIVCGTFYKRCELRAFRKDGSLYDEKERITLSVEEVEDLSWGQK